MKPFFIVVTASYNRPALLKRNIEALLGQTCANWCQVIVDDASSQDMSEAFALAATDERITVLRNEANQGCNATRNRALDWVRDNVLQGYVSYVDDDDYLLPDALERVSALIESSPGFPWYTADCAYPDGSKASRLARHGRLSYLHDYMFGKVIKGDLNHFIHTDLLANIRFTDKVRNGQEWSFYCQLSGKTDFMAFDANVKVVEYLDDGLTRQKVNSQERLKVYQLKVDVLAPLVSKKQLSGQQLLLARELLANNRSADARVVLKSIARYQWCSLKFLRYFFKAVFGKVK